MANANTPPKIYDNLMRREFQKYKKISKKMGIITTVACVAAFILTLVITTLMNVGIFSLFLTILAVFSTFNLAETYPYVARMEINDAVKNARLNFIESYGLKITDTELSKLNFPFPFDTNVKQNAKQKIYGTAFVTDEASGSARKVTLKGLSDKSVGLFDEKDEPLQPSKQFTNQTINSK